MRISDWSSDVCSSDLDLGRRLPQPTLDLAQVGVGDPRHLRELAQRQVADAALVADELSQLPPAQLEVAHASRLRDAREQPAVSRERRRALVPLLQEGVDGGFAALVATDDLRLERVDAVEEGPALLRHPSLEGVELAGDRAEPLVVDLLQVGQLGGADDGVAIALDRKSPRLNTSH